MGGSVNSIIVAELLQRPKLSGIFYCLIKLLLQSSNVHIRGWGIKQRILTGVVEVKWGHL